MDLATARSDLARWFVANARILPWRTERSVYRTVVSEFMLQQTRVSTVIPYFERWTTEFPGFAELAEAEEERVVGLWQGLGYYSRARNLHRLAQEVATNGVPSRIEDWLRLPGIGGYTSAAIASIAQGMPHAVVDGNVVRVLARLSANGTTWKAAGEAVKAYGAMADEFLDRSKPGDHNEAVMELGALVCLPRSPLCTVCPLVRHCLGAAQGVAEELPRIVKPRKKEVSVRRVWMEREGQLLLIEYPKGAKRLAGICEIPRLEDLPEGFSTDSEPFTKKKRGIGNESITEWFHRGTEIGELPSTSLLRWVPINDLAGVSLSGPHRKWIGQIVGAK